MVVEKGKSIKGEKWIQDKHYKTIVNWLNKKTKINHE